MLLNELPHENFLRTPLPEAYGNLGFRGEIFQFIRIFAPL